MEVYLKRGRRKKDRSGSDSDLDQNGSVNVYVKVFTKGASEAQLERIVMFTIGAGQVQER